MPPHESDQDKLNRIEELKNKLFTKNYHAETKGLDDFSLQKKSVPDAWAGKGAGTAGRAQYVAKKSAYRKFFIFSIIFFVLALGYAAYMYFAGGNTVSNDNIDISVVGNAFATGGEEFPLVIGVTNRNSSPLELVDLVVEYPKGGSSDATKDTERFRESLGTIAAGATKNDSLKVVLYGEQGSTREIKISVEYRVAGSNAIFVKEKPYDVSINSSPISLSMDAPAEISPNQELTFSVKEVLNATKPMDGILMKLDYPFGFQFESATPKPTYDDDVWDLGTLAPGADRTITITGKMIDVFDGEEKTFHVTSGSQSSADKSVVGVVFNAIEHVVAIKKPFIEAKLYVNGVYQKEYASDTRTLITGEIRWVNNLDTPVNDVQVRATITGNALDRKSIDANGGFYNSVDNAIIWDKNFRNQFAQIDPGASGSLVFRFSPLASVDMLTDPAINIEISITGKQPLEGNAVKEVNSTDSQIVRITSSLGLATKALYYSGPFKNTGPIPAGRGKRDDLYRRLEPFQHHQQHLPGKGDFVAAAMGAFRRHHFAGERGPQVRCGHQADNMEHRQHTEECRSRRERQGGFFPGRAPAFALAAQQRAVHHQ
ncbi:MAG: hypothetical protein WDN09_00225 [bacterium]